MYKSSHIIIQSVVEIAKVTNQSCKGNNGLWDVKVSSKVGEKFLRFRKRETCLQVPRREKIGEVCIYFRWSLGTTTRHDFCSHNCVTCPNYIDSIWHAPLECPKTHWIWKGFGRILQSSKVQGTLKWGNACWLSWHDPIDKCKH